jgi:hypothetical protein
VKKEEKRKQTKKKKKKVKIYSRQLHFLGICNDLHGKVFYRLLFGGNSWKNKSPIKLNSPSKSRRKSQFLSSCRHPKETFGQKRSIY